MYRVLAIVMAGGAGERLMPLTRERAKPAVPFGGKFRLIDFTLSNCVNSGIRKIFVLTQYKSASLNRHLQEGWGISSSGLGEFVYSMPAQQKLGATWYEGTADAVRQNLDLIKGKNIEYILILSGDHVYKMDYSQILEYHVRRGASLTVSALNVSVAEAAGRLGVLDVDPDQNIVAFYEKPAQPKARPDMPGRVFASMGIYVFCVDVLLDALKGSERDFGTQVIPGMISRGQSISAYSFEKENRIRECSIRFDDGEIKLTPGMGTVDSAYWRDVGTIDSYYEASMDLLGERPLFDLYNISWPVRTYRRDLPPSKCVGSGSTCGSLISEGCVINSASVASSVISPGVIVERDAVIENSVVFDNVIIGPGVRIRRAIVDKQVRILPGVSVGYDPKADVSRGCVVSPNGVVVVPKDSVIR